MKTILLSLSLMIVMVGCYAKDPKIEVTRIIAGKDTIMYIENEYTFDVSKAHGTWGGKRFKGDTVFFDINFVQHQRCQK